MKERKENLFSDTEILMSEAYDLFLSKNNYGEEGGQYSIEQACEDIIKKYNVDPIRLSAEIMRETSFIPHDIFQRIIPNRKKTPQELALTISSMLLGNKINRDFMDIENERKNAKSIKKLNS